jgi:hypothetical protein
MTVASTPFISGVPFLLVLDLSPECRIGVPLSRRQDCCDDLRNVGQNEVTVCCVKCDIRTIYGVT